MDAAEVGGCAEEGMLRNIGDLDRPVEGVRSLAEEAVYSTRPRPSHPRPGVITQHPSLFSFFPPFFGRSACARMNWQKIQSQSSTPVRHQFQLHQPDSHHHPPSPGPLLTPRASAHPNSKASSFAASVRSVFHRSPHHAASTNSLRSAYSATSSVKPPSYTSNPDTASIHPYASMAPAPLPVVSSHDASDEEEECPVCLEPLSSSFRLPGEKPHIVPECGHALHEVSLPLFLIVNIHISNVLPAILTTVYHRLFPKYPPPPT